jgi:hypothetical protein
VGSSGSTRTALAGRPRPRSITIDGKLVIFGTGDTPQQAAALLPASLRSKSTACVARGVKRKAPLTPVELCDHVAQGSEEGSLSAELNALEKKNPYRPPLSPLRVAPFVEALRGASASASGYIIRRTILESQRAGGGVCSKF